MTKQERIEEFMKENDSICMQDLLEFICHTIGKYNKNINISTRVMADGRNYFVKFNEHKENTIDIAC